MRPPQNGFTMIELMVVVAIAALLIAVAVPSFVDQIGRRRLEGVANELVADLFYARTEAVSKNKQVQLASDAAGTSYTINYVVSAVTPALKTHPFASGVASTAGATIVFDPLRGGAPTANTIDLTSSQTGASLRASVSSSGQVGLCSPSATFPGYAAC